MKIYALPDLPSNALASGYTIQALKSKGEKLTTDAARRYPIHCYGVKSGVNLDNI